MAEITIDNTERQGEGEFTAEEQEAIKVGEQLHQEEQTKLAGKYDNAAELEKAYMELQQKFSEGSERKPEEIEAPQEEEPKAEKEEAPVEGDNILDTLYNELGQGGPSDETLKKLGEMGPDDIAKMHLEYRMDQEKGQELSEDSIGKLQGAVGGPEAYQNMMGWAKENLSENEIAMYDEVMGRGDELSCFFAVQALAGRFKDNIGYEGEMLTGKAPKGNPVDAFRSQAEVVKAMQDSRYDDDPAYRQDVFDKLARSNIQY